MKTISVDDDVYRFIASQTEEIGESASDILRRLLKLTSTHPGCGSQSAPNVTHELQDLIGSPNFEIQSPLERFLAILSWAYQRKAEDFEKVLAVQGRDRLYFAKSEAEITQSGRSTQPKQIPDSPYWVMTNAPTRQKADMIRQVLRLLGFSTACAEAGARSLRGDWNF